MHFKFFLLFSACRFLTFIYDPNRRSRDRMVIRYTTTLQSVHITTNVVSSNPTGCAIDTTLCDKVCM